MAVKTDREFYLLLTTLLQSGSDNGKTMARKQCPALGGELSISAAGRNPNPRGVLEMTMKFDRHFSTITNKVTNNVHVIYMKIT